MGKIDPARARNHLANERTFLAWIRTSLGIMAFGFVVEKFALFISEIAVVLAKPETPKTLPAHTSLFGILLIGLGALIGLFAFIQYKRIKKQIDQNVYHSHQILAGALTLIILAIGVFLIYYLLHS